MSNEIWKDIPGWEGLYQASSEGRIKRLAGMSTLLHRNGKMMQRAVKERVLSPGFAKRTGYWVVAFSDRGRKETWSVHKAVAFAFHGPRPDGLDVAHKDGVRANNRPGNLSFKTRKDNLADEIEHGTRLHGERRWNAKLTADDVFDIISLRRGGETQKVIAKKYGIYPSVISQIMSGKTWFRTTGFPNTRGGCHI